MIAPTSSKPHPVLAGKSAGHPIPKFNIPISTVNFNLEMYPKMGEASTISNMAVLSEEAAAQEMVIAKEEVITKEELVTQAVVVTKEEISSKEEVVTQEVVVTQEEVPQAIGDTLVDDAPKLATITESPTKATGSLVDKVLWKGTPLKELTFESQTKQQQLLNTIHQLEKTDAVKSGYIYVSTVLTNMEVRSTNSPS